VYVSGIFSGTEVLAVSVVCMLVGSFLELRCCQ